VDYGIGGDAFDWQGMDLGLLVEPGFNIVV
jgi:hypothetical protein